MCQCRALQMEQAFTRFRVEAEEGGRTEKVKLSHLRLTYPTGLPFLPLSVVIIQLNNV
jgi:hypothetical protein